jgi:hypothetical protein
VQPDEIEKLNRPATKAETAVLDIGKKYQPNHQPNYTRNVRLTSAGTPTSIIKKIHPPLLIEFNGKIVVP